MLQWHPSLRRSPVRHPSGRRLDRIAMTFPAVAAAMVIASSPTLAAADPASKAAADALFNRGYALILAAKQSEGCALVQQSVDLEASLTAEDLLIDCDIAFLRPGRAALENDRLTLHLNLALKGAADPGRRGRIEAMLHNAESRVVELKAKLAALPRLTLRFPPGVMALADLTVELDGIALPPAVWSTPVAVDPGHHIIKARARGKKPFSAALDVTAAASVTIALADDEPASWPAGAIAPTASPMPNGASAPLANPNAPAATSPWLTGREIGIGASLATGVVGFAIGAGFGAAFVEAREAYPRDCARGAETCRDGTNSDQRYQQAIDLRTTETIALVAGGVGVGAAALLWFLVPESSPSKPAPARPTTAVSVGPGGIRLIGSF